MPETECNAETIVNVLSEEVQLISIHEEEPDVKGTIYKVPHFLRHGNEGAYTPKLVSIGPYHHGEDALAEMEHIKLSYFRDFTQRSGCVLHDYVAVVEQNVDRVKMEYSSGLGFDRTEFVKMMVIDCCFIIEFLAKWFVCDSKSQAKTLMTKLPMLRNDLLLVENQIPFFLLHLMFETFNTKKITSGDLSCVALAFFFEGDKVDAWENSCMQDFDHLLHLYHTCQVFVRGRRVRPVRAKIGRYRQAKVWLWGIPNACNLRDTGFSFEKKYAKEYDFMDVSRSGNKIKIPVLCIRESMLVLFRNLVALEQCSNKYGNHFTAYAMFMDYLVDTREDVAMLKERGIIDNRLGDDQKVADFFNDLCKGIRLDEDEHYLSPLFNYVTEYYTFSNYKVRLYRWRKRFIPDYFTNPWAIPSMIAALILLALAALQTFYTVYAYYRPPSPSPSPT